MGGAGLPANTAAELAAVLAAVTKRRQQLAARMPQRAYV
jgi:hypothetical protein